MPSLAPTLCPSPSSAIKKEYKWQSSNDLLQRKGMIYLMKVSRVEKPHNMSGK